MSVEERGVRGRMLVHWVPNRPALLLIVGLCSSAGVCGCTSRCSARGLAALGWEPLNGLAQASATLHYLEHPSAFFFSYSTIFFLVNRGHTLFGPNPACMSKDSPGYTKPSYSIPHSTDIRGLNSLSKDFSTGLRLRTIAIIPSMLFIQNDHYPQLATPILIDVK